MKRLRLSLNLIQQGCLFLRFINFMILDGVSNETVNHSFLTRSQPRPVNPTNLGTFPFQCVTDLTECQDGFTLSLTIKSDKGNPKLRHQYLLSRSV